MSATTLATVIHGTIACGLIIAATVLLALHDLDSTTAMALYTAAIGVAGGTASTLLALKVPAAPPS
jgi:hypothetical protein